MLTALLLHSVCSAPPISSQVRLGTYSTKTAHKPPAAEVALRAMVADPRCDGALR